MKANEFFAKNQKYILIIAISLFFIKSFQSCSRNMTIKKLDKEIIHLSDSLTTMMDNETGTLVLQLQKANDSIKELNYEVKLAKSRATSADRRANAVQSTASKIRENTTIKIENNNRDDSVSVNK